MPGTLVPRKMPKRQARTSMRSRRLNRLQRKLLTRRVSQQCASHSRISESIGSETRLIRDLTLVHFSRPCLRARSLDLSDALIVSLH